MSSDVQFYLTVYCSIAVANTVFTALRAFLFAYGTIGAATTIHHRLLDRVLKVRHLGFDPPECLWLAHDALHGLWLCCVCAMEGSHKKL